MSSYLFKHPVTPLNNVDGNFVNVDGSNWPGRFGSIETSREFALPDNYSCNASAANASRLQAGGKRRRTLRKKIKNIVNKYRMSSKKMRKQTKKRLLSLYKRKGLKTGKKSGNTRRRRRGGNTVLNGPIVSQNLKLVNGSSSYNNSVGPVDSVVDPYDINRMLGGKRYRGHKKSKKSKKQRGGYHQFQSDIPMTQTYSRGGILDAKDLGLANPAPYQVLPNCTNCIDNYDYNTNRGFQFWGN